jgi:5S rRNA maturation endonuclease (ribonuclease M5)
VEGNKDEQETRKNVDKEEIETVGEDGAEEA